jgi:hypothetical protein
MRSCNVQVLRDPTGQGTQRELTPDGARRQRAQGRDCVGAATPHDDARIGGQLVRIERPVTRRFHDRAPVIGLGRQEWECDGV